MIRGILLDSGDTLVRPVGGEWVPGPRFRDILAARGVADFPPDNLRRAIDGGAEYLDRNHHLSTVQQEVEQFQRFYDIMLSILGVENRDDLSLELARDIVLGQNLEPFPDTASGLRELRNLGLRLGIVSNSWPSMDWKYRALGLRHNFDCFVVSALVGAVKPNRRIFEVSVEALELPANEILFVDDDPENVRAAIDLGMHGALMTRDGAPVDAGSRYVTSIAGIVGLLAAGIG